MSCQHNSFLLPWEKYLTKCVGCMIPLTYVEHSLFYTSHSLHLAAYSCAQFHTVIYSWSLRTSQTHLHHRLHPVWSLSSFSTGSCRRRKPGEEKRCRDQTVEGPRLLAFRRSCQSFQLCGAVELVLTAEELLCSCQSGSLMLLLRGKEWRGQQSSVRCPTGCFRWVHVRSR